MSKRNKFCFPIKKTKNRMKIWMAIGFTAVCLTACSTKEHNESFEDKSAIEAQDNVAHKKDEVNNKSVKTGSKDKMDSTGNPVTENRENNGGKEDISQDNAVKDKEHVPIDTKDNDTEQRRMEVPTIELNEETDVYEAIKNVSFSDFNLDTANPRQIKDVNSPFVLANKANYFPENFKPNNLVIPAIPFSFSGQNEKKYLQKPAADALTILIQAAAAEEIAISGVSGYRSIARQKVIYKYNVDTYGQAHADKYSAKPMYSEHHTGLCMDVSSASVGFDLVEKYGNTKEGKWLATNAHKYGFVIRYPKGKENLTGYSYEPWHIRYFGIALATYLYENNLCYEEFVAAMQKKDPVPVAPKDEKLSSQEPDDSRKSTEPTENSDSSNTSAENKTQPTDGSKAEEEEMQHKSEKAADENSGQGEDDDNSEDATDSK